jgi:hypothetical protein
MWARIASTACGESAQLGSGRVRVAGVYPVPPVRADRRRLMTGSLASLHPLVWISGTDGDLAAQEVLYQLS